MTDEPRSPADRQLARLAADLRDRGRTPARDLWPGVDAAITAAERRQIRPAPPRRRAWARWAAVAAVLAVLLGTGWWGGRQLPGRSDPAEPVAQGDAPRTGTDQLAAIDLALGEVNQALAADPENRSLTNLAVMLHRSRGRVLLRSDVMRVTGS